MPLVGVGKVWRAAIGGSERSVPQRALITYVSVVVVTLRPTFILFNILLNKILQICTFSFVPLMSRAVFVLINVGVNIGTSMRSICLRIIQI